MLKITTARIKLVVAALKDASPPLTFSSLSKILGSDTGPARNCWDSKASKYAGIEKRKIPKTSVAKTV